MTYSEFQKLLEKRGVYRIRPSLGRLSAVLRVLDNPQDAYPTIHIAGTNGKGSVAAALESVLRASGYRTALYTSPHLMDLRERFQINGTPLTKGILNAVRQVLDAERTARVTLTHFELLTAIGFLSFKKAQADIAIVECGMGGQWDATNTIRSPLLSIITSIGLDHQDYLGRTEKKIAEQKAGIIKNGHPVISGVRGEGRRIIARIARRRGATLAEIDKDFNAKWVRKATDDAPTRIAYFSSGVLKAVVPFGLIGQYQVDNAAIVMTAISELVKQGWTISQENRDKGLQSIHWPGRFQTVQLGRFAPILLDGAHNPPALKALIDSIKSSRFKNVLKTFVFSAFKDKDYLTMGKMISSIADEICLCPLPGLRAAKLSDLRNSMKSPRGPVRSLRDPESALKAALSDTPREGVVIVCGSLALVGAVLNVLPTRASRVVSHV